jgi:hypothetical protein
MSIQHVQLRRRLLCLISILTYIQWFQTQQTTRLLRVALEGYLAGLVVATPFALFGGGESSLAMQPIAYVWTEKTIFCL